MKPLINSKNPAHIKLYSEALTKKGITHTIGQDPHDHPGYQLISVDEKDYKTARGILYPGRLEGSTGNEEGPVSFKPRNKQKKL